MMGFQCSIQSTQITRLPILKLRFQHIQRRILPKKSLILLEMKDFGQAPISRNLIGTTKIIGIPISAIVVKLPSDTISKKTGEVKETSTKDEEKFEGVFVNNEGKAELRVVTTGIQDDSNIEITSGLTEGEIVITGPYNLVTKKLKSGDKVEEESSESKKEKEEDSDE